MISILFFLLGLFFGSFLLVVIDRVPRGESILFGRSHCDMCSHVLNWYDLIPIFSYLFLRGRCRYCHKPYGMQYPFVEIATGVVFGLTPFFFPFVSVLQYILLLGISASCIIVFFTDYFYGIIPDSALLGGGLFTLGLHVVLHQNILSYMLIALVTAGFFFALFLATKQRGIGFGDVKYALFMGFLLGYPSIILGLYAAFLTGAVVALILILGKKKHFRGDTIAFGPFLVLGTYIAWVGGIQLWHFFIHLLFQV